METTDFIYHCLQLTLCQFVKSDVLHTHRKSSKKQKSLHHLKANTNTIDIRLQITTNKLQYIDYIGYNLVI